MKATGTQAADYDARLEDLNREFAGLLPGRLDEIETLWRHLARGEWDGERLRRVTRRVHLLSGSSSTFGFPEVGRAATALERRLKSWSGLEEGPVAEELEEGSTLVAALRSAL